VIGYGAILPAWDTGFVLQGKFIMLWCFIPYNKSFIDQAYSVKMAGYRPALITRVGTPSQFMPYLLKLL